MLTLFAAGQVGVGILRLIGLYTWDLSGTDTAAPSPAPTTFLPTIPGETYAPSSTPTGLPTSASASGALAPLCASCVSWMRTV